MKLPRGATGFNAPPGEEPDLGTFTTVCYHAARAIGATVTGVIKADVTPSFHTIDVAQAQHHIAVLRHTTVPLVAFARPRTSGDATITFIDRPDLAAAITNLTDAQILTAEQLGIPLPQADLSALGPHEHDQINYWKPNTVGELLFNFWD
ncbi:hypothetical protein E1212_29090 [Jiangella ureilytica]|uniref:Uncharacterized protein n=1 Tax=Jiangella ureilytica TaxID=2530374 RepID=A0A4R4R8M2_9ACTN|nr:hypothetical protein [Jiangella ureilytica]TDC45250.1 hypothetical protein E1212_29090 [Jiangella ureilytica]